jgi:hypothetical protein
LLLVTTVTIRSSIMSHITFEMCQFVLIIYLRDYHYDFDLDIVVVWSWYGVLRLTYTTYQNLCPTDHFFGRLLMSQDISPTWIVLLESIYRIIHVFFRIFPMSKIVLWFDFLCPFFILLNFRNYLFSCPILHIPRNRIFLCFSSFRQVHLHLSPTANWRQ